MVKWFTSLAVKRFTSLTVKRFTSLAVHKLSGQVAHKLSGQAAHELIRHPVVNPTSAGSHGMWYLCTLLGSASSSSSVCAVVSGEVHLGSSPLPSLFFFLPLSHQCDGCLEWGSWLGCGDLPAMGAVFYL